MRKNLLLAAAAVLTYLSMQAQQLPNMGFDTWSKQGGVWYPYAKDAPESRMVWDSANKGLNLLGVNTTVPEYKHTAVAGKAAAKVQSKKVLWAFVAGNLFTGRFIRVVEMSGAEMEFGAPFSGRPKSLSGFFHYLPSTINYAQAPYKHLKGKQDVGRIEVILTDWTEPQHIDTTKEPFIDAEKNPHVVGRAVLDLKDATDGYVPFEIPIEYRNGKTPKYAFIFVTPSRYGACFTGGSGSTLYVDEFRFNY